jgi:hypothetical protein
MNELNTRVELENLLKERGFSEVISTLGEIAKDTEAIIKRDADSTLASCFSMCFLMLMDCIDRAGKKNQAFIKNAIVGQFFQNGLNLIGWSHQNQSPSMKEAYKKVMEWKNE